MPEQSRAGVSSRRESLRGVTAETPHIPRNTSSVGDSPFTGMTAPSQESILEVIRKASGLLRAGWCRGFASVDAEGRPTHYPEAGPPAAFSLPCAVRAAADGGIVGEHAIRVLRRLTGTHNLSEWNDHPLRTKRDVLDLLGLAMEACGGRRPRRGGWTVGGVL
jgi:hypothetical protein